MKYSDFFGFGCHLQTYFTITEWTNLQGDLFCVDNDWWWCWDILFQTKAVYIWVLTLWLQYGTKKLNENNKRASTYRQVFFNEFKDNVVTDEDPCPSDASAAVNSDRPLVVHGPHVADESNQLLWAVWHTVVRPVCEFQVMNKVGLTSLEW